MASRRRIAWTREGQSTLDEVVTYLFDESPAAARQVLAEALDGAASLAALSERGRLVPEFAGTSIREIFIHRYRLLYLVTDDTVFILAFIHGARDFARWRFDSEA